MSWYTLGGVFTFWGAGQGDEESKLKADVKTKRSLEQAIELYEEKINVFQLGIKAYEIRLHRPHNPRRHAMDAGEVEDFMKNVEEREVNVERLSAAQSALARARCELADVEERLAGREEQGARGRNSAGRPGMWLGMAMGAAGLAGCFAVGAMRGRSR